MGRIAVSRVNDTTFNVRVEQDGTTEHAVTLAPEYHRKLTDGKISAELLIERSFEFLLERESNRSILRSFSLPQIGDYFPEFEGEIRKILSQEKPNTARNQG